MMTNLFSIFDPSSSNLLSSNWISLFCWMIFIPSTFFIMPNRVKILFKKIFHYIFSEFKPLITKNPQILIISVTIFSFIMLNNLPGLIPFTFTATSHMTISLSLALPFWIGVMIHGWTFNYNNLLIHLIPNETPFILMPFMVIIETISNVIRPLTLAIRLAANMIAGHLLLSILMSASEFSSIITYPLLFSVQTALSTLEIAVALIQAYVFSVLLTIYTSESIS